MTLQEWLQQECRPGFTNREQVLYMLNEVLSRYEECGEVQLLIGDEYEATLSLRRL